MSWLFALSNIANLNQYKHKKFETFVAWSTWIEECLLVLNFHEKKVSYFANFSRKPKKVWKKGEKCRLNCCKNLAKVHSRKQKISWQAFECSRVVFASTIKCKQQTRSATFIMAKSRHPSQKPYKARSRSGFCRKHVITTLALVRSKCGWHCLWGRSWEGRPWGSCSLPPHSPASPSASPWIGKPSVLKTIQKIPIFTLPWKWTAVIGLAWD